MNLSPAIQLMIMGLVVAAGPLVWIWLRNRHAPLARRLQVLTLVTLFFTFDLVIFGAFTRLTDSGLGCPDWPGCYGHASPVGAQLHIEAAQTAMPTGPVTHHKAWIEMVHRYLATGVGVLILTLAVASWLAYRRTTRRAVTDVVGDDMLSPWWPTATLLWVCLQGAFGALTVTMKLFPLIVTFHLLGGLVLLLLLKAQSVHYAQADGATARVTLSSPLRAFALIAFVLLWLQIALGGWVSTNYAVLACTDFPACQGSFWPAMDFHQAFTLWRELGSTGSGDNISFQALTAIHYVHRLGAYVLFAAMLVLAWRLHRVAALRGPARWLAGLILLQAATGLSNVVLGWPLVAAAMHTGGAAALVIVMTGVVFGTRSAARVASGSKSGVRPLSA
jgi:heme a synthase